MPTIRTRFFGVMDYASEDVITFPVGIPPFVSSTRFLLLSNEKKQPLVFLQSVEDEHLCFITIPIRVIDPGYRFAVEPHDLATIAWPHERKPAADDLISLAILTIPEAGPVTANLLGPVLINAHVHRGVQAVRADSLYTHAQALDGTLRPGGAVC